MEKAKQRSDSTSRMSVTKPTTKENKEPPEKERGHLHGVIRNGRFYLD